MDLPQFDELHVISDIHMGGEPGFQILRETKRLAGFIDWVAGQLPDGRVALVLNGDIVDTLAEKIDGYVAVHDAEATIDRIMKYPQFAPIWKALAAFVRTDKRTLVLVLGNHDLELAFPNVQRLIVRRLAGDELAAQARIEFSTMGAGFACQVASARVFCTHANEVDAWNYVRYEDLAKAARRIATGRSLPAAEWEPNAGTKLVKDVMNEVKRKYAWIDLLKPERSAAVGVLLVLDPKQLTKINRVLPIVGELAEGMLDFDQRLSATGFVRPDTTRTAQPSAERLLGRHLRQGINGGDVQSADDLLLHVEKTYRLNGPAAATPENTLGTGQLIWDRLIGWLRNVSEAEALRRALKDWLAEDKTFELGDRDQTFRAVTANIGSEIDFVVTGHTHLERAIEFAPGRYYFNTGTWIRLLRFTDSMLASEESFTPIYQVLQNGTMSALDAGTGGQPLLLDQSSSVCIRAEGSRAVGELVHVTGDGTKRTTVGAPFRRG